MMLYIFRLILNQNLLILGQLKKMWDIVLFALIQIVQVAFIIILR